jgi:hypothetical protein
VKRGAQVVVATSASARRYVEEQSRSGHWPVSAAKRVLLKLDEIVRKARIIHEDAVSSSKESLEDGVQSVNNAWADVVRISVENLGRYRHAHPAKAEQALHNFKRRLNPQGPLSRAIYDSLNYPACQ